MVDSTTEVYEIDYRGPETHSSIPPPGHFHGKKKPLPNGIHNHSVVIGSTPKSKNSGGNYNMGRKVRSNYIDKFKLYDIRVSLLRVLGHLLRVDIHTTPHPEC